PAATSSDVVSNDETAAAPAPIERAAEAPSGMAPAAAVPVSPDAQQAAPAPAPPPSIPFLVVVTTLSLAADLATKYWAKEYLSGASRHVREARRIHVLA